MAEKLCFSFWQSQEIFLFSRVSRPAVDPSKPPFHWVLGAFSLGVEQPRHEDDPTHSSSIKVKNEWRYSSIYLHGIRKSEFTLPQQTSFIRVECLLHCVFSSKIIALKKIWNSLALAGSTAAAVPAIKLVECVTLQGQLAHLAPESACSYASCFRSSRKFLVFSGMSAPDTSMFCWF